MNTFSEHPKCKLCNAEAGLELDLTERAVAEKYGVHRKSVYRHRQHLIRESPQESSSDSFLERFNIPERTVTTRHVSAKDENGNWQKVAWKPNSVEIAEDAFSYDDIERALSRTSSFVKPSKTNGRTLVVCAADYQIGKVASGGDTESVIERIKSVYDQLEAHVINNPYSEIVFTDLGDVVESFTNTVQQAQTNDRSLTEQIRIAQRLLLEGVKRFAPYTNKLTMVSVSSNHCGVRSGVGNKNKSHFPGDDYGLMIQDNIKLILEGRVEYSHVSFVQTPRFEEAVTYTTQDGTTIGFTHGHLAGSQVKMGDWFKGQSHGRRSNMHNADMLIFGHFHSPYLASSGDGRLVIGAPTMDNGSDWFSNSTGESNPPGMLTFEVNAGEMESWKIWRSK